MHLELLAYHPFNELLQKGEVGDWAITGWASIKQWFLEKGELMAKLNLVYKTEPLLLKKQGVVSIFYPVIY